MNKDKKSSDDAVNSAIIGLLGLGLLALSLQLYVAIECLSS